MLNVYIAGASSEAVRAQHWIDRCKEEGLRITYDWTVPVLEHGTMGEELTQARKRFYARADLRGIEEAEVFWLLSPSPGLTTIGAWIEMGYAMAAFRHLPTRGVVVSPPVSDRTIFAELQKVIELDSDELAFEHLLRL